MKWTEKEETILKNNFFDKTGPELALMLDRTLFSIKAKIKSLGLTKRRKRISKEVYQKSPKNCKQCQKILSYNKKHNTFCSLSCAAIFNNKKFDRHNGVRDKVENCLFCEESIVNKSGKKFCSQQCFHEYKWENKTKPKYLKLLKEKKTISGRQLRKLILKMRPYVCEICKRAEWRGKKIPLEVDHIDGNFKNNEFSNLRLLCRNCHGQTPTFGAKNMGNGRKSRTLVSKKG